MGKRANHSHFIDTVEEDFDFNPNVITCTECGGDNIFAESISAEEWAGQHPINRSVTRYTCLNPVCGHYWDKSA